MTTTALVRTDTTALVKKELKAKENTENRQVVVHVFDKVIDTAGMLIRNPVFSIVGGFALIQWLRQPRHKVNKWTLGGVAYEEQVNYTMIDEGMVFELEAALLTAGIIGALAQAGVGEAIGSIIKTTGTAAAGIIGAIAPK